MLFTLLIGAFALGETSPNAEAFVIAQGAAHQVYKIIDSVRKASFSPSVKIASFTLLAQKQKYAA